MNRKKAVGLLVFLLLVQMLAHPQEMLPGTSQLLPQTKVSLTNPEITFFQRYDILSLALLIYKLDAIERYPKEVVKETIMRDYDRTFFTLTGVRFDLEHIDIGRKGWTRYYPFVIHDKLYLIRIFKTEERAYQPDVEVLLEGQLNDPDVIFQILPGVNSILKECRIKPYTIVDDHKPIVSP